MQKDSTNRLCTDRFRNLFHFANILSIEVITHLMWSSSNCSWLLFIWPLFSFKWRHEWCWNAYAWYSETDQSVCCKQLHYKTAAEILNTYHMVPALFIDQWKVIKHKGSAAQCSLFVAFKAKNFVFSYWFCNDIAHTICIRMKCRFLTISLLCSFVLFLDWTRLEILCKAAMDVLGVIRQLMWYH